MLRQGNRVVGDVLRQSNCLIADLLHIVLTFKIQNGK